MTVDERPYGLTKAALNSLVQGLAYRYVNENFRINAVAPGVTISDMVGGDANGDLRLVILLIAITCQRKSQKLPPSCSLMLQTA